MTPEEQQRLDSLARQSHREQADEDLSDAIDETNCWTVDAQRELLARLQALLEDHRLLADDPHVSELLADVVARGRDLLDEIRARPPER